MDTCLGWQQLQGAFAGANAGEVYGLDAASVFVSSPAGSPLLLRAAFVVCDYIVNTAWAPPALGTWVTDS